MVTLLEVFALTLNNTQGNESRKLSGIVSISDYMNDCSKEIQKTETCVWSYHSRTYSLGKMIIVERFSYASVNHHDFDWLIVIAGASRSLPNWIPWVPRRLVTLMRHHESPLQCQLNGHPNKRHRQIGSGSRLICQRRCQICKTSSTKSISFPRTHQNKFRLS